jgi:hypothetical protein
VRGTDSRWYSVPTPRHARPQAVSLARRVEPRRASRLPKWKLQEWELDNRRDRRAKMAAIPTAVVCQIMDNQRRTSATILLQRSLVSAASHRFGSRSSERMRVRNKRLRPTAKAKIGGHALIKRSAQFRLTSSERHCFNFRARLVRPLAQFRKRQLMPLSP